MRARYVLSPFSAAYLVMYQLCQIMGVKSKGFVVPSFADGADSSTKERIYTDEEKKRMRAAIQAASSLAEMARLEKDFSEGRIPAYILEGGDPMET